MSDVDCLTQLEQAVRACLEAGVPLAKRVLGPEDVGADRPIMAKWLSCLIVDIGDLDPSYLGAEENGDRQLQERWQVDVMCVSDTGEKDYTRQSRALMFQARAALAAGMPFGLPLDDFRLVGAKPQSFATEKGLGGGFHLAFAATFMTRELDPAAFIPTH